MLHLLTCVNYQAIGGQCETMHILQDGRDEIRAYIDRHSVIREMLNRFDRHQQSPFKCIPNAQPFPGTGTTV